ncbi:sensor histidine kinase [Kineococcus sp. SYSU DK003]|uniref:sensor histidine kinase n=1 Tax=Kineococcus sp. SYSU DK003 TaxID=3383124 RepID=UPI003D7CBB53
MRAARITGDVVAVLLCWTLGLALVGFDLEESPGLRPDAVVALDLLLGLLGVPLLFLRRRWPLVVALVLAAFSVVSYAVVLACGVALFAVTVRRRWQVAVTVAVASGLAGLVQMLLWPDPDLPWWLGTLLEAAVLVGILAWGMYVRARRQLAQSWREQAERARAEEELRADQARSVERARIAREMHDVLAHRISLVSMHAGALELRLEGAADPEVVASAATIHRSARAALDDLRVVLGVLRAEDGREQPAAQPALADVPGLVEEVRASGVRVELDIAAQDVPDALGRTVFRVVQEGLTNVRKHAPGHRVRVRVEGRRGRRLQVVVADRPGDGDAPALDAPSSGFGLVGLRERVELVGGTVRTHRTADGFELLARLPWPRRS